MHCKLPRSPCRIMSRGITDARASDDVSLASPLSMPPTTKARDLEREVFGGSESELSSDEDDGPLFYLPSRAILLIV